MILVDFSEYAAMKKRLQSFLDKEISNEIEKEKNSKEVEKETEHDGQEKTLIVDEKENSEEEAEEKPKTSIKLREKRSIVYGKGNSTHQNPERLPQPGIPENPSYRLVGEGELSDESTYDLDSLKPKKIKSRKTTKTNFVWIRTK